MPHTWTLKWVYKELGGTTLLLDGYENNIDNPEKINILDAFRLAVPTWVEDVSLATIANCFRHCKIRTNDIIHTQQGEVGPPTALTLLHIVPFCEGPNKKSKGFAKEKQKT